MKKNRKCLLAFAIGFIASSTPTFADERDEIKQRIEALRVEAKELASAGREEEAKARMNLIRELTGKLKGLSGPRADVQGSEDDPKRNDLHRWEMFELQQMANHLAKRLEHLQVAAKHLKEGDMPDMAHEVGRRAEQLENELRAVKESFTIASEKHAGAKERDEKMPLLAPQREKPQLVQPKQAAEHEAWGARVKEELTRHAETIGDVRAEQEKMRRELKELRSLIERLTSEAKGREQPRKDSTGRD